MGFCMLLQVCLQGKFLAVGLLRKCVSVRYFIIPSKESYRFSLPVIMYESACFSIALPIEYVAKLLNFYQSNR